MDEGTKFAVLVIGFLFIAFSFGAFLDINHDNRFRKANESCLQLGHEWILENNIWLCK